MTWSPEQDRALASIDRWMGDDGGNQIYRLFGYAGTGKTMLAREIGKSVHHVAFCAFTGKAAEVMRRRGCEPSSTIHSLIYKTTYDRDRKRWVHTLKQPHELEKLDLIIVDEASMVSLDLAEKLMSFERPLLVIGDPAQLPPVEGGGTGAFMLDEPDSMLTQIHRQAENSSILQLAQRVREGGSLWRIGYKADDGAVQIVDTERRGELRTADIVLAGLRMTRHNRNKRLRKLHGFLGHGEYKTPQVRESLVCLRNDYSLNSPIFNGERWRVLGCSGTCPLHLVLESEYAKSVIKVQVDPDAFTDFKFEFNPDTHWQHFDYGYFLTVHKAQGSEWPHVTLLNEAGWFREHARAWLYTGITRASKRLTVVDFS